MKRFLTIVGSALFGSCLAIIAVEGMGHLLKLAPVIPGEDYYAVRDLVGPYPEPYSHFHYSRFGEFNAWVHFNGRSLRDVNHTLTPDSNQTRIMVLGDSYTSGWQVDQHETYVAQLRDLMTMHSSTSTYELINAGFHGWGTDRQTVWYEIEGARYESQIVLLQIFVGNDILDNGIAVFEQSRQVNDLNVILVPVDDVRPYFTLTTTGQLEFTPPRNVPLTREERVGGLRSFLAARSYAYQLLASLDRPSQAAVDVDTTVSSFLDKQQMPIDYFAFSPTVADDVEWQTAWALTQQLVQALQAEVEAHNGELMVLVIDSRYALSELAWDELRTRWDFPEDWEPTYWGEQVRDYLAVSEIPYLDLHEPFQAFRSISAAPLLFPIDGHFTPTGHCVTSIALYQWFVEQDVLQDEAASPQPDVSLCQTNLIE